MTYISPCELFSDLKQNHYVNVPFPMDRSMIEEAVQAFFKFLEEPEDVKAHINYSIAPRNRRGEVGYRYRDPADHIYNDSKEFFHYHPSMFKKHPAFIMSNPVVNDFLTKAQPIWEMTSQIVGQILKALEPEFPGFQSKVFDGNEEIFIMLRFLKYEWTASNKYLAKPHFDAGSCTLAIAESTHGLRIGSGPDDMKLVEHKPENAVFMLASNFNTVMNTEKLSPAWHDVIQLNENMIGKPYARWAVVAFIEAQGVEALPRSETHKHYMPEVA